MTRGVPRFLRVDVDFYETASGAFSMRRDDGVWNVLANEGVLPEDLDLPDPLIVSAPTRGDALEAFAAWWAARASGRFRRVRSSCGDALVNEGDSP